MLGEITFAGTGDVAVDGDVELAIEEIENSEAHNKMLSKLRHPSLKTKSPLEEQAVEVLTPFAFKKFQEEFERASRHKSVLNLESESSS
ncbi:hypothetical protein Tco_1203510 [Tanacetum coccineum]